ncbi:MAG: hypothetical protein Q9214_007453, partial [Letrouitia sp. 1 TL-2023]
LDRSVLDRDTLAGDWAVEFNAAAHRAKQQVASAHQASQLTFDAMLDAEVRRQDEYYRLLAQA